MVVIATMIMISAFSVFFFIFALVKWFTTFLFQNKSTHRCYDVRQVFVGPLCFICVRFIVHVHACDDRMDVNKEHHLQAPCLSKVNLLLNTLYFYFIIIFFYLCAAMALWSFSSSYFHFIINTRNF